MKKWHRGGAFDEVIATKFVNFDGSAYEKWLNYSKFKGGDEAELAIKLPKSAHIVEKTSYSLPEKALKKLFKKGDEVFVCGFDYDSCVQAILFQLFDHEIRPYVLMKLVGSHSKNPISIEDFKRNCIKNFGKDCVVE